MEESEYEKKIRLELVSKMKRLISLLEEEQSKAFDKLACINAGLAGARWQWLNGTVPGAIGRKVKLTLRAGESSYLLPAGSTTELFITGLDVYYDDVQISYAMPTKKGAPNKTKKGTVWLKRVLDISGIQ